MSQDHYEAIENAYMDLQDALDALSSAIARHAVLAVNDSPDVAYPRRQQIRHWNNEAKVKLAKLVADANERTKGVPQPKRDQRAKSAYYRQLRQMRKGK